MRRATLFAILLSAAAVHAQPWTHFAGSPARQSQAPVGPAIVSPRWVASVDPQGAPITFVGQSGPVTLGQRVYALGRSGGTDRLLAIERSSGVVQWGAPVPAPVLGSWSSPATDPVNGVVLVAAGSVVLAIDAADGSLRWQTPLPRPVVNASPLVTTDLGSRDRVFITDFDGFGGSAALHCINADPHHPVENPFQPGDIVWTVPIGGSSGNSPAYANGVVYVATAGDESGLPPGRVLAFPAGAVAPPSPLWTAASPAGLSFFGGVSVRAGTVYAASYNFAGSIHSADLLAIDAATGTLRWSVASNRTAATPIPLGSGLVALSGGLRGFGTVPSISLYRDDGTHASRLWDSAVDTWIDLNSNGTMDPGEYLAVGGWTHQPAATPGRLYTGVIPAAAVPTASGIELFVLDLSLHPSSPGFVAGHFTGAGSTPAITDGWLLTIGPGGLHAFAPPCYPDCNADALLNLADFGCFQTRFALANPYADCNGDGVLNLADFGCFQTRFALGCP